MQDKLFQICDTLCITCGAPNYCIINSVIFGKLLEVGFVHLLPKLVHPYPSKKQKPLPSFESFDHIVATLGKPLSTTNTGLDLCSDFKK